MISKVAVSAGLLAAAVATGWATGSDVDGAVPGKWTMDLEAAKSVAAEKKLPILMNFSGSDWCSWCQLMESGVFEKPEWSTYASNNLMMVLIDFPQNKELVPEKYNERNRELSSSYGVEGFPTFILLDSDGQTELGRLGAGQGKTPESFRGEISALMKNSASAREAYLASLSEEARAEYQALVAMLEKTKAAIKVEQQALQAAQDKLEELQASELEQDDKLRDFRVAQLSEEEQKTYNELKTQFDTKRTELESWIATQPEPNEENMAKFQGWQGEIQAIALKLQAY